MLKQGVRKILEGLGYEISRIESPSTRRSQAPAAPAPMDPVWPLPRRPGGLPDDEIVGKFAAYDSWHYGYEFEGGLVFHTRYNKAELGGGTHARPLQRFRHFMPYLLGSQDGTLEGKRVLDIACNSGFWSIQCALRGAEVVGFDARPELIEQANLVKSIVGAGNVDFRVLDFWDMSTQSLGGKFDVVLNLGILYHLPRTLEALELTKSMARKTFLLDTGIHPGHNPAIALGWEDSDDIRATASSGIVGYPTRSAIDLMLKHLRVADWFEIPIRSRDMPHDYLTNRRATWLVTV